MKQAGDATLGPATRHIVATRPAALSGKVRIDIKRGLVTRWQDLADYFEVPAHEKARFEARGDEPEHLLRWLEERKAPGGSP